MSEIEENKKLYCDVCGELVAIRHGAVCLIPKNRVYCIACYNGMLDNIDVLDVDDTHVYIKLGIKRISVPRPNPHICLASDEEVAMIVKSDQIPPKSKQIVAHKLHIFFDC